MHKSNRRRSHTVLEKQGGVGRGENMKIVVLEGSPHKKGSFEDVGMVLGIGCGSPSMTKNRRIRK